ncbi:MAG TPA: tyrosine-type recombinase/integrase [Candidatus Thermoplasmatota archaeon]|nr:tyrosine-type recombinase/integrase [Candidatus Thermoplasmatota archaeon]
MAEARNRRGTPAMSEDRAKLHAGYLRDLEARSVTPKTILTYGSATKLFLEWLDQIPPERVDLAELKDFKDYLERVRKISPKSIMRYYSALQSFYDYLHFEGKVKANPVPTYRRRYLKPVRREAMKDRSGLRQVPDIETTKRYVHSIMDVRDQALVVLLLKCGIRREEAVDIDLEDIDWREFSILLKPKAKRTNTLVYFDDETARVLRRWLSIRKARGAGDSGPLFINQSRERLQRSGIYNGVRNSAAEAGIHDPKGGLRAKFTPHACRHWFTTHLRRAGMPREHIQWLRGDAPQAAMDIYIQVDKNAVRETYRNCIPQLGL